MNTPAGDQCPAMRIVGGKRFVCVREPHDFQSPTSGYVADYRRRQGEVPAPDRHYFVAEERAE